MKETIDKNSIVPKQIFDSMANADSLLERLKGCISDLKQIGIKVEYQIDDSVFRNSLEQII